MHLDALGYLHQPRVDQVPDLAPTLCASVRKRIANRRTVKEAVGDNTWVRGIRGGLSALASSEYLQLWYLLISFELTPAIDDQHIWMPSLSGEFTTKSANHHFFVGSVKFGTWREIWKAWAPPRCRFFVWLASLNCCWTADRLSHHGLDHLERCPLCDQEEETVRHLLTSCLFARSVWFSVL